MAAPFALFPVADPGGGGGGGDAPPPPRAGKKKKKEEEEEEEEKEKKSAKSYFLFLSFSVIARCFVSFILVQFFFTFVFMLQFCL